MSATVIAMIRRMTRWGPDARGRLMQSALDPYAKHGYDQTTVAEIALGAGLTERTFFRHFADKKEVLFAGSDDLRDLLVGAVAAAPASAPPIAAVAAGLLAASAAFNDDRRAFSMRRQSIIAANAELRERELIKLARAGLGNRRDAAPARCLRPGRQPDRRGRNRGLPGRLPTLGRRLQRARMVRARTRLRSQH